MNETPPSSADSRKSIRGPASASVSASDVELLRRAAAAGVIDPQQVERGLREQRSGESIFESLIRTGALGDFDLSRIERWHDQSCRLAGSTDEPGMDDTRTGKETGTEAQSLRGLPERYELTASLGGGGMGDVFLARDNRLKRQVAIKVLNKGRFSSWRQQMMARECEILAKLDDPGIVRVFDSGTLEDGSPFFVMQYVDGLSLDAYMAKAKLDLPAIVRLAESLAVGLSRAHLVKIIHRDLKPQNIRVNPDGQPIILDFGLAKPIALEDLLEGEDQQEFSYETQVSGVRVGTLPYMSPEQSAGLAVDSRTDVYALGVILYELLAGRLPISREVLARCTTAEALRECPPPPLDRVAPHVPADLAALVHKCLAVNPLDRFADGGEVAEELRRWNAVMPLGCYQAGRPWYVMRKFVRRNPLGSGIATIACVSVISAVVAGMLYWQSSVTLSTRERLHAQEKKSGELEKMLLEKENQAEKDRITFELREKERRADEEARGRRVLQTEMASFYTSEGEPRRATEALASLDHPHFELHRLSLENGASSVPIEGIGHHEFEILSFIGSRDGRFLVSSGADGRVLVWDTQTRGSRALEDGEWSKDRGLYRPFMTTLPGEPSDAALPDVYPRLQWVEEGRSVVGVSMRGHHVVVWDIASGERTLAHSLKRPLVSVGSDDAGRLLVSDRDGTLWLGGIRSEPAFTALPHQCAAAVDIIWLPLIGWCVGTEDGEIVTLAADGMTVVERRLVGKPIWDLDLSVDGKNLAVAASEGSVQTFELPTDGKLLSNAKTYKLPKVSSGPYAACTVLWDRDSRRLFAGNQDGSMVAWNTSTGQVEWTVVGSARGQVPDSFWSKLPRVFQRKIAGLSLSAAGDVLYSAGADTWVRSWKIVTDSHVTTLALTKGARLVCDDEPSLFWVTAGRNVQLLDSVSGKVLAQADELPDDQIGLARARDGARVVTWSRNRIYSWRRTTAGLVAAADALDYDVEVRQVAIHPDGEQVAVYDVQDRVSVWDVATRQLVAQRLLQEADDGTSAVSGALAYDPTGATLGVCGPAQSVWILRSPDLSVLERPYVAADIGGTALSWSQSLPPVLLVGDTSGRVRNYPHVARFGGLALPTTPAPVAAIAWTPAEDRIARALANGEVMLVDPTIGERVLEVRSRHSAISATQLVDATFDPTGRRLILTHDDGVIEVWETTTAPRVRALARIAARPWETSASALDASWRVGSHVAIRPSSLDLDRDDRVVALFGLGESCDNEGGSPRYNSRLFLGRDSPAGWQTEVVRQWSNTPTIWPADVQMTLSLSTRGDELCLVHGQPAVGKPDVVRELISRRWDGRTWSEASLLREPLNVGLDPQILWAKNGECWLTHFMNGGYYLVLTRPEAGAHETYTIGCQGDGNKHVATIDDSSVLHIAMTNYRFTGQPGMGLHYLRVSDPKVDYAPGGGTSQQRETIEHFPDSFPHSITLDQEGRPGVLYRSLLEKRAWMGGELCQLLWARRTDEGWRHSVITDLIGGTAPVSNHVETPDGRIYFALEDGGELLLVSGDGQAWTAEPIFRNSAKSPAKAFALVLRLDQRQRPVVIEFATVQGIPHVRTHRLAE